MGWPDLDYFLSQRLRDDMEITSGFADYSQSNQRNTERKNVTFSWKFTLCFWFSSYQDEDIIHNYTFFSSFLTWRTRLPLNLTWFRTLNVTTHLSYSFWEFPSCCWTLSGSWDHGMFFWIYDSTWGFIFIILIKMQHVNAVVVTETVEINTMIHMFWKISSNLSYKKERCFVGWHIYDIFLCS